MRLAIMQPYFFPYLGYFELIDKVDHLVLYDTAQYIKNGWVNRNRIMADEGEWKYLTVPLEKASFVDSYRTTIEKIRVSSNEPWRERIFSSIAVYKGYAPGFEAVCDLLSVVLNSPAETISKLDELALRRICEAIGLEAELSLSSDLGLTTNSSDGPQEKVLRICQAIGADCYVNLAGGRALYDPLAFERFGIKLEFLQDREFRVPDQPELVPSNLSVLDAMMWSGPEEIRACLRCEVDSCK